MDQKTELKIELAKNKADEFTVKKELENAKKEFINTLNNGIGNEMRTFDINSYNVPRKIKKTFLMKIKDFFNKLFKVIGF